MNVFCASPVLHCKISKISKSFKICIGPVSYRFQYYVNVIVYFDQYFGCYGQTFKSKTRLL